MNAFNSASFICVNVKANDLVIYSTSDASWNPLSLTIKNNTGSDVSLVGGTPVNSAQAQGASSFAFDFGLILTADQVQGLSIVPPSNWGALYFQPQDSHSLPTWAVAPKEDLILKNGEEVVFNLSGIVCTSQSPGNFDLIYYNVAGMSRSFPFVYTVKVLNPPVGADLTKVLNCGIMLMSEKHVIQPASNPPVDDGATVPVAVDITYDNNFPIQNGFTVYLKNNSSSPLVPLDKPLGQASFTFFFLFGTDDDDAITTPKLGDAVTIGVDSSKWSSRQHQQGTGNWPFIPQSPGIITADESVSFPVDQLVVPAGVNPNTLSTLLVQWNFIPGYADGYFSIDLQKVKAIPDIPAFNIVPTNPTVGENVKINYQTKVAAYVTLDYVKRDGTQVILASPNDIGFDEQNFPIAPDAENTVFNLSVYCRPGQKPVKTWPFPITVNQLPASIDAFVVSSNPVDIKGNNVVTLSWKVQNAKTVEVQGFGVQSGNSLPVTVTATTIYTLKVTPWGTGGKPVFASLTAFAYKTFPSLPPLLVGKMGDGTVFQSLPISIASRTRRMIYVANAAEGSIYQISVDSYTVSPTRLAGNIMALTTDELFLFAAQQGGSGPGSVAMFDTGTGAAFGTWTETVPPPYSLAIAPTGTAVYYLQQHKLTNVSAFSVNEGGKSFAYIKDIVVGTSPEAYAFDATGAQLYVGNYDSSSVSVIDVATNAVTATIQLQSGEPCAFALVGTILFVACSGGNQVCVIDTTNNTTLAPITTGPRPFSLTLDQNKARLFVTNFQGATVSVIDTASQKVTATLAVGKGPSAAKITDSGRLMFVSNYCDKSLTLVDLTNGNAVVAGTIPLAETNGNPVDVSTFAKEGFYTDVFVAKEYFKERNDACKNTAATDANLEVSLFSIQETPPPGLPASDGCAPRRDPSTAD